MATRTDQELVEELLHREESSELDFKREQYPFANATDDQKVELLKDILAFANADRDQDAYILVGVEDVQGGRGLVVGVSDHPDDAALQQFVNGKTQRPVHFAYRAISFQGVQVGLFEVRVQTRPLYLTKDYSRLKAQAVYVRRGSSTAIATPDEVAGMGATPLAREAAARERAEEWRRRANLIASVSGENRNPPLSRITFHLLSSDDTTAFPAEHARLFVHGLPGGTFEGVCVEDTLRVRTVANAHRLAIYDLPLSVEATKAVWAELVWKSGSIWLRREARGATPIPAVSSDWSGKVPFDLRFDKERNPERLPAKPSWAPPT